MFKPVTDEDAGCAVWYCGPGETTHAQWEQAYDVVRAAATWRAKYGTRLAVMQVIDPEFPMPNAEQRTRLRAGIHEPSFDPFVAFVHDNAFLRGFLTTINWARPQRRSETAFFKTIGEAQVWLEERRGQKLAVFKELCAQTGVPRKYDP